MLDGSDKPAVLLDALGTLLRLEPPAPRLRAALRERLGIDVGAAAALTAMRLEIGYYRRHLDEGRDPAALADLRRRCAAALRPGLPAAVAAAPLEELTAALADALAFVRYPDAPPALRALRAAGHRLIVVSNWDVSLHERLAETGLAPLLDGAVASAELGVAKPARGIFDAALALAGAETAWHVGDTPAVDVAGARAAGLRPVLLARAGGAAADGEAGRDVPVIGSLAELPALLAGAA